MGTIIGVDTSDRVAALTFDDGPNEQWTPAVLELLARYGAQATFFVVGAMASRFPGLVERIARAGHAIGNHSWNHPSFPTLSGREQRSQIERCEACIATYSRKLFRPPFGDLDFPTAVRIRRAGFTIVGWNAMARDWAPRSADSILTVLASQLRPGAILLLHDNLFAYSPTDEPSRTAMLAALARLLAGKQDYRFVTVPELLSRGRPQRRLWIKRSAHEWLAGLESYAGLGHSAGQRS